MIPTMKTSHTVLGAFLAIASTAACGSSKAGGGGADTTTTLVSGSSSITVSGTGGTGGSTALVVYGQPFTGGQYNLGPVDYAESQFHNACAPTTKYPSAVQQVEGDLLAGLWDGIPNVADYCDACIWVTTAKGKSALLRVVTYGQTSTNSIDVSPQAYQILNTGEYPRTMTWQFAECADSTPVMYEFQTGSSQWWTSLWVRNARVPLAKVEVLSVNHTSYTELSRGTDGTLTDASGFGLGQFTLRSTGVDGQVVTDDFNWPVAGIAGAFLVGQGNFN